MTLTASAANVTEGGSITWRAWNNPVIGSPLVITLTGGTTITIPVGSSGASARQVDWQRTTRTSRVDV